MIGDSTSLRPPAHLRPSVRDAAPPEQGGPVARKGFAYQDQIAISFLIDMISDATLEAVQCETHDDLVLLRQEGESWTAEFVQVKAVEPDKLWSVADICARSASSLLETSLSRDRYAEDARFRIVTLRPVTKELRPLERPFDTGREAIDSPGMRALCGYLQERFAGLTSPNGHGVAFWLERCFWDVRHDVTTVQRINELSLLKAARDADVRLDHSVLGQMLAELEGMAKTASNAHWRPGDSSKTILRPAVLDWWRRRLDEVRAAYPSGEGSSRERDGGSHAIRVFRVPPLPGHFVRRPEIEARLVAAVASNSNRRGVLVAGAVQGIGGLGKSTLAASIVDHPQIVSRFPDGVFWVTLGQQPDLTGLILGCIRDLGDHRFEASSLDAASGHLRTLLREQACLVVIDDAWQLDHVRPLLALGDPGRVLITTRNADVARAVGAELFPLDVMTPPDALQLIEQKLNRKLSTGERPLASDICSQLGFLPLALHLAAAQVASGATWNALLDDLRREIARLDRIKIAGRLAEFGISSEQLKDYSLLASFNLTIQRLDLEARRCFAWLGVLADDSVFDARICSTLWETSESGAQDILSYLHDKAVVYEVGAEIGQARSYRMHDLLHDTARIVLTSENLPDAIVDIPSLGVPFAKANGDFLRRHLERSACPNCWHGIPDDGYIHARVVQHMLTSDTPGVLNDLLAETGSDGRHGWFGTRERAGQISAFIRDVEAAEQSIGHASSVDNLRQRWRYKLQLATIDSLSDRIPAELVALLVKDGLWTAAQALTYARRIGDPEKRAQTLVELLNNRLIGGEEQSLACGEVLAFSSQLISEIGGHCTEVQREEAARNVWRQAQSGRSEAMRSTLDALEQLNLVEPILADLRVAAHAPLKRGTRWDDLDRQIGRLELLSTLSRYCPLEERASLARIVRDSYSGLPENYWADDLRGQVAYVEALTHLDAQVPPLDRLRLRRKTWMKKRAELQFRLARLKGDSEDGRALWSNLADTLTHIKNKKECVDLICCYTSLFPVTMRQALFEHAFNVCLSLDRLTEKGTYLGKLYYTTPLESPLRSQIRREATVAARSVQAAQSRASSICELAFNLGNPEHWSELGDPIEAARSVEDPVKRCLHLSRLASCLDGGQRIALLREAATTINELRDLEAQATALMSCAEHLPPEARSSIVGHCAELMVAFAADSAGDAVALIGRIAKCGPSPPIVDKLAAASKQIGDHRLRAIALIILAQKMTGVKAGAAVQGAYSAVLRIAKHVERHSGGTISDTLALLVPLLNEAQLRDAVDRTTIIKWNHSHVDRAEDLGKACWIFALAPGLTGHPQLWDKSKAIASALKYYDYYSDGDTMRHYYREHALYGLCAHAPEPRLDEAIEILLSCQPVSNVDRGDFGYPLALASLMRRTNGAPRERLAERLLDTIDKLQWCPHPLFEASLSAELTERALHRAHAAGHLERVLISVYLASGRRGRKTIMIGLRTADRAVRRAVLLRIRKASGRVRHRDRYPRRASKEHGRGYVLQQCAEALGGIDREFGAAGVAAMADSIMESARWWP